VELIVVFVLGMVLVLGMLLFGAIDAKRQSENKPKLLKAIHELESRSPDRDAQLRFLSFLNGLYLPQDGYSLALGKALSILESNPSDQAIYNQFWAFVSRIPQWFGINHGYVYGRALKLLSSDSGPTTKQFVLQVARWHHAKLRPDGKLTIYDEQAIQTHIDILANSKA
jgi:hypothetical protein